MRIFWYCVTQERSDGYYHLWTNWITGESHLVFAGYNRKALNRKSTTFQTVKEKRKP